MKGKWNKGHEMLPTNGEHMEIVIKLSGYCEKDKNGQVYFFVDGKDEGYQQYQRKHDRRYHKANRTEDIVVHCRKEDVYESHFCGRVFFEQ